VDMFAGRAFNAASPMRALASCIELASPHHTRMIFV